MVTSASSSGIPVLSTTTTLTVAPRSVVDVVAPGAGVVVLVLVEDGAPVVGGAAVVVVVAAGGAADRSRKRPPSRLPAAKSKLAPQQTRLPLRRSCTVSGDSSSAGAGVSRSVPPATKTIFAWPRRPCRSRI